MTARLDTIQEPPYSMSSSSNVSTHDLGSLRIDHSQRKGSGAGKKLGIFAALLGIVVIATGAVFAFRNQKPVVQVATVDKGSVGTRPALLNASGYVTPRRRATVAANRPCRFRCLVHPVRGRQPELDHGREPGQHLRL